MVLVGAAAAREREVVPVEHAADRPRLRLHVLDLVVVGNQIAHAVDETLLTVKAQPLLGLGEPGE